MVWGPLPLNLGYDPLPQRKDNRATPKKGAQPPTLNPKTQSYPERTSHPQSQLYNPKPQTPNPKPQTLNPIYSPNPKPETPNPRPSTPPNPKPQNPESTKGLCALRIAGSIPGSCSQLAAFISTSEVLGFWGLGFRVWGLGFKV